MKYFVYTIIGIVSAAVIAGFFIVGSPAEGRLHKLDDRRVQDLQFIQNEIVNYWSNKERLPQSFYDLEADTLRGVVVPSDPETGELYIYEIKDADKLEFSLCAVFARPSLDADPLVKPTHQRGDYYSSQQNWQHDVGAVCFDRSIDKDVYGQDRLAPAKPIY
ncbi:MAG: hypothetical protein Q8O87_01130 [bacterium]|nr:hypothetical protein [bacterium]